MTPRTRSIIAWTPAVMVGIFLIVASGLPKLFLSQDGSSLQAFATALDIWDIIFIIGVIEVVCAALYLIPRTSTVGFILLIGLLGGAMATGLTHTAEGNWPFFPLILIGLMMLSAYFRNPELLARVRKQPVPTVSKLMKIVSWIFAILVAFGFGMAAVMKFVPVEPDSVQALMTERLGFTAMEDMLGVLQLIILILFLIPRTSTVGFVLMVGYIGGILATELSHEFTQMEILPIYIIFAFLTISAIGRNPELLSRILGKPVTAKI